MASNTPLFRKPASRPAQARANSHAQHGSRAELVYQKIRGAIERGDLRPGERVMEVEVAEWLDVSRTPVREALRKLEAEGMLAMEPRTGLVVASLTRHAMMELYVMRE